MGALTIELIQLWAHSQYNECLCCHLYIFLEGTAEDGEMQDGMKNEPGQIETQALLNACKQSEPNCSSEKGKVLECDQFE